MLRALNSNDTGYSPVAGSLAHNYEHTAVYLPENLEFS